MSLTKASSQVIETIYPSQILPSGAAEGYVLQYKESLGSWTPSTLDTKVKYVTTSYQITLDDANSIIRMSSPSNVTLTVPYNTLANFVIGTQVVVIQEGVGKITFSKASGVTLVANEERYKTYGQWSGAVLIKLQANTWFLGGDISDT